MCFCAYCFRLLRAEILLLIVGQCTCTQASHVAMRDSPAPAWPMPCFASTLSSISVNVSYNLAGIAVVVVVAVERDDGRLPGRCEFAKSVVAQPALATT
ncbi:hypothetical protein BD413DRAFT_557241 [Trametes elegans]|nr:hypothetical protein BD413DRAFT_557241 [Trametes elegans]